MTRPVFNGLHSVWVFVLIAADCIRVACPVSTKLGDLKALVSQVSSVHICGFEDERGALPEVWIAARTCTIKAILQCVDEPCICDYKYALEACDRPATHDVHSIPAEVSHRAGGDHDPQDGVFWFSVFVCTPDDARHCVQIHGGMKIDTLLQIVPFDLMPGDEPGFFHGCRAICGDHTFGESRVAPHDLLQIRLKRAARGVKNDPIEPMPSISPTIAWEVSDRDGALVPLPKASCAFTKVWLWSDGLCVCEDQVDGDVTAPQIALSMHQRTRLHCDIFFEGAEIPSVPIRQLQNDFGVVHFDAVVKHADGRLAADLMQPARWQLWVKLPAGRTFVMQAKPSSPGWIIMQHCRMQGLEVTDDVYLAFGPRGINMNAPLEAQGLHHESCISVYFRTKGGTGGGFKPDTILRAKGRAMGLLIGRGAEPKSSSDLIDRLFEAAKHEVVVHAVMQSNDRAACDDLCTVGSKHDCDIAGLLPRLRPPVSGAAKRDVKGQPDPKAKFRPARIDLKRAAFPDGLFLHDDGSHAAVHTSWSIVKRGVMLDLPHNFGELAIAGNALSISEHTFLSTVQVETALPWSSEQVAIPISDGVRPCLMRLFLIHASQTKIRVARPTNTDVTVRRPLFFYLRPFNEIGHRVRGADYLSPPSRPS